MATNGDAAPTSAGDEWVCLISEDNFRFVLRKSVAMGSNILKATLSEGEGGNFAETETNEVTIPYRGIVVSKVVEYLAYKAQYQDVPTRDVIEDYTERIEPELALELLMAADYLDC